MDFLAELGFAPLPTVPAAGMGSSTSDIRAGHDAGFADYMRQPLDGALIEAEATGTSAVPDRHAGTQAVAGELDDLTRSGQPAPGTELGPDAPADRQVLEPKRALSGELVPDGATPHPSAAMAGSQLGTSPSSDESPALKMVEEQGSGRPATGKPDDEVLKDEAIVELPILMPNPLAKAPTEPSPPRAKDSEADGSSSRHSTGTSPLMHGDEAAPQSPSPGKDSDLRLLAVDSPQRDQESTVAGGLSAATSSAPLKSAGSTSREQRGPLTEAHNVGRTGEPKQSPVPAADADNSSDAPSLEKPTRQNSRLESVVRGIEEVGSKQPPSSDLQIGRIPHLVGPASNAGTPLHAPAGMLADSHLAIARGSDEAVSIRSPAHHQVVLHITKVLDQDKTAIRIELDPSELGEVDIDLEFHHLRLTATVRAERSDVLDLLQRDVRTLARALREAGVELADSDISFSHGERGGHDGHSASTQRSVGLSGIFVAAAPLQDLPVAQALREGFVSLSDGRMDLRV